MVRRALDLPPVDPIQGFQAPKKEFVPNVRKTRVRVGGFVWQSALMNTANKAVQLKPLRAFTLTFERT